MKNNFTKAKNTIYLILIMALLTVIFSSGCNIISISSGPASGQAQDSAQKTGEKSSVPESSPENTVQPSAPSSTTVTSAGQDKSKEIEAKFNEIGQDTGSIENIFQFINENIGNANNELAGNMVYSVMKLCEEYAFTFSDKFADPEIQQAIFDLSSGEVIDLEKLKNSSNNNLKTLAAEAENKKYKLASVEGFIMPMVDYSAYSIYRQYLSQEMNDYMDIKQEESNRPSVLDAGIVIPLDDFIQRILKSDIYLAAYPDSARAGEVKKYNHGRMQIYLGGIDNSPVFDFGLKILPEKLAEFENNAVKHNGTKFAETLNSFLKLLKQENYIKTQKVDDFLASEDY